ncbi:MAG: replication initiation factor domain-containing protein [Oscillospiraceae bacterium]|nr:replication initiation factor domain-containing protein [Oscillospiraceae bacterium]
MVTDNLIVVDWLSFRCETMDFMEMAMYLGMADCTWSDGAGFYRFRFRRWCSGVSIHDGSDKVPGVLVEMSGTGCRAFETFSCVSWRRIFEDILNRPDFIVTRLDIAFDDHQGCIPIKKVFTDVGKQYYVSRFKERSIIREDHPGHVGQTIYFGSAQSEIRFRMYDKAYERKLDSSVHWVRFEMQLRRDMAFEFIRQLFEHDFEYGALFSAVVSNYVRMLKPPKDKTDTNKRRWEIAPYWCRLIGEVLPVSLWVKKDLEYNRSNCERYVYKQAGNSIAALIELDGLEGFKYELMKHKSPKVPQRISNMIATEKALRKESKENESS